jgi:hypothetical protein
MAFLFPASASYLNIDELETLSISVLTRSIAQSSTGWWLPAWVTLIFLTALR